jgi:predicted esterase
MLRNLLCLHGRGHTISSFKVATTSLRKRCQDINFAYLEGPYVYGNGRSYCDIDNDIKTVLNLDYNERILSKSLELLDTKIKDNNITMLLGFSQGGLLVDTYLRKYALNNTQIKKAVIMSGFSFKDLVNINENVHVFNIVSPVDIIISPIYAPKHYKYIKTGNHQYGHRIPKGEILDDIREFLIN